MAGEKEKPGAPFEPFGYLKKRSSIVINRESRTSQEAPGFVVCDFSNLGP